MKIRGKVLGVFLAVLMAAVFSAGLLASAAPGGVSGAATLTENFDNVAALTDSGWILQNNSNPGGVNKWFQGTSVTATPSPGPFDSYNGVANAYIAANYASTTGTGTISNWLVTPELYLTNGSTFTFYTRKPLITAGQTDYPDRLEVRLSTSGSSINVGTLATDTGDFGTLLLSINPTLTTGVYPQTWTQYTVTVTGISTPTSGRIALRYFVTNGGSTGSNSDYIGVDAVTYTAADPADLSVTNTVSDSSPDVGDTVDFTLTATNSGPGAATTVAVTDLLPTGLTFEDSDPSQGSYDSGTGVWTVGSLASGSSATLTLSASVDAAGPVTNTATVSAYQSDPGSGNNTASAVVTGYGTIDYSDSLNEVTYDGGDYGISLDITTPDVTVNYRTTSSGAYNLTTAPTYSNSGTYTVWYEITKEYYNTVEDSAVVKINASELTVSASVNDKDYDGLDTATFDGTPSLVGVVDGDDVTLVNGTPTFSSVNAANDISVNITAFSLTGDDAGNYSLTQPTGITADILPKELTVNVSVSDKDYDGLDTASFDGTPSLVGIVDGDTVNLVNGTPSFSSTSAADDISVNITPFSLTGDDAGNYSLTQPTGITADILPKELTVNVSVSDKDYDGLNTAAFNGTPSLVGIVDGDTVNLVDGTPTFSSVRAANDISVNITPFSLTGDDAANYSLTQPAGITADILPKELTVNVSVSDKHYDGLNTASFDGTPSLVGVVDGDTVTLVNGTPTFSSVVVGSDIGVNLTGFSLNGDDADNYSLVQPTGITADILVGFTPVKDSHYTVTGLNTDGSLSASFVITAKTGYLVSLTNAAEGTWQASLSYANKTGSSVTFYLKNAATGEISVAKTYNVVYKVLSGFPSFTGSGSLTASIDAPLADFLRLTYNGQTIDPSNYTTSSGSTVITLKDSYLKTLQNGTYTFRVEFSGGYSELTLVVNFDHQPDTGDNSSSALWAALCVASLLGMCSLAATRHRRRKQTGK